MLDLQQVYRAQLMSLWEGIEGSQKFLPYVPGRHLIAEASSFTELNAATYKPKQGVALFLLDDLLLVAVRKKRQMSARVRLVAERCFSLGEIIVIDLKDGGELTNAVKIKRGKETFVYRTERAEDKRALLNAFRKVAEELANKRRKESLAEAEARKRESTLVGGGAGAGGAMSRTTAGGRIHASTLLGPHGASSGTGENGSVLAAAAATAATEKKDPGRWINDFSDELAVAIALREWGDAVSMVEKGKGALSTYDVADPAHQSLSAKLAHHTSLLVAAITHDLSSPYLKKTSVVRNASYLLRLDKGEKAREIFLAARSELLRRRSRQIKFEGDVSLYISELALVHFTLVKNTSEWYMSAFKDNRMASGFVRWASAQIEAYAEIFRRQVYGVADQDPKVVSEAIEITKSSANQLKEVGLSFGFLLEDLLKPDGTDRPIPALTLTLADEPSEAATHRLSAQEIRRQSAMLHR
ncbi:Exocyst complex subunit [Ceraceosorus bombacis]|uniref:Exocyst complex component EXO84 n=1 Tax=Ceraceosorus bombacis TaxID=401625 RepID=A0A0N7L9G4_9BASI|nr:Exocyst complex subunit [Ceraceosorus bombacis]